MLKIRRNPVKQIFLQNPLNPEKQRGCPFYLPSSSPSVVIRRGFCRTSRIPFIYGGFVRFTSTWCKTFAIILDIFILWVGSFFGYANGVWVLGEVVGIELSNAAFQFEDAGVTGADECVFVGDELILGRELVTERLNEVVFGF